MLTIFSIPKPFTGHIRVIQRNAIASWLRVADEVILFGDEKDGAEAARDLGAYHVLPNVARNRLGTPLLSDAFREAERMCRTPFLAYVNADIILRDDFKRAASLLPSRPVLLAGRRWDVDITEQLDFGDPGWSKALERRARKTGVERGLMSIDYFVFRPRTLGELPPFAVGRPYWDVWLLFHARASGVWVVDASPSVVVIHQNHDYSHVPHAVGSCWEGPEADENFRLAGGHRRFLFSLAHASHRLENGKLVRCRSLSALRLSWKTLHLLNPELAVEPPFFTRLTRPRRAVVPFLKPLTCRVFAALNALRVPMIPVWRTLRR
jgi:hypothetical protein